MASHTAGSLLKSWAARASDVLASLGQSWLREFLALFPRRMADWLAGRGARTLVLVTRHDAVDLQLLGDGRRPLASARVPPAGFSPAAIDALLRSHRLDRAGVALGVRLPAEKFFHRTIVLPVETLRSLDAVVAQDLARKTPFRLDDVFHDYTARRAPGADRIEVCQWVTRREFVRDAVAALGLELRAVAFVDAEPEGSADAPSPLVRLHAKHGGQSRLVRPALIGLTLSAVLLGLVAAGLDYWRQQAILDDLENEVAAAKSKAQQVRTAIDKLQQQQALVLRIRSRKAETPGLLDVWEETTRRLPAHSWLTELRLSETPDRHEQQVAMTGLSTEASTLVGLLDQSALFADASLTAPVTLDPVEGRERFGLQAKIRAQAR